MDEQRRDPFCDKGCKDAYDHEKGCAPPSSYEPAVDPVAYGSLTNEALVKTYSLFPISRSHPL